MSDESTTERREESASQASGVPGMLRLRGAGVGVIIGGIGLGVLSFLFSYLVSAGILLLVAVAAGAYVRGDLILMQLSVGVGAVGLIGLIEAETSYGFGLEPLALAAVAVFFGLFDVVAGSLLHQYRPGRE